MKYLPPKIVPLGLGFDMGPFEENPRFSEFLGSPAIIFKPIDYNFVFKFLREYKTLLSKFVTIGPH